MSYTQNNILKDFKTKFPNHSLRKISSLTGINASRLFRVFNGHEMKVSELEKFQAVLIESKDSPSVELLDLSRTCYKFLSQDRIQKIVDEIKFNLICYS